MAAHHAESIQTQLFAMAEGEVVAQDLLGEGAHGSVFAGWLRGPGDLLRRVALKVPKAVALADPEMRARLADEVRLGALVEHPGVVRYHGVTLSEDGVQAVVLGLVDGEDLGPCLTREGALPPSVVCEAGARIADALDHIHSARGPDGQHLELVHRDLKPANLRLTPDGRCVLLDLGIATARSDIRAAETQHGFFGSAGYMAPERLTGGDGAPSDVFSLGVVLWEMATGRPLGIHAEFDEEDHLAWVQLRLGQLSHEAEALLEPIRACLAYAPEDRPTAAELSAWLGALRLKGPTLRAWACRRVQRLKLSAPPEAWTAAWRGSLEPETERVGASSAASTVSGSLPRPRMATFALAAVAVLAPMSATAAWWLAPGEPESVATTAIPDASPIPSEDAPRVVQPPATAPAPPDPPAERRPTRTAKQSRTVSTPKPSPAPEVEPSPPEEEQPPPAPVPPSGWLRVEGDAHSVRVVGPDGQIAVPGRVPVGAYAVASVTFGTRTVLGLPAWTAHVSPDGTAVFSCRSSFDSCTTRESP